MNTVSKFALFMLLLATISSTLHTVHLSDEVKLEFYEFKDHQDPSYLLKGDGQQPENRCPVVTLLCREDDKDWIITPLGIVCPEFPISYRISGARKDAERKELIELGAAGRINHFSDCRFFMEQALQFLK
jgi:hypothetical protein